MTGVWRMNDEDDRREDEEGMRGLIKSMQCLLYYKLQKNFKKIMQNSHYILLNPE